MSSHTNPYHSPNGSSRSNRNDSNRSYIPSTGKISDLQNQVHLLRNDVNSLRRDFDDVIASQNRIYTRLLQTERMVIRFNNLDNFIRTQVSSITAHARISTSSITRLLECTANTVQENKNDMSHIKQLIFSLQNTTDEIYQAHKRKRFDDDVGTNKKASSPLISDKELASMREAFVNSLTQPTQEEASQPNQKEPSQPTISADSEGKDVPSSELEHSEEEKKSEDCPTSETEVSRNESRIENRKEALNKSQIEATSTLDESANPNDEHDDYEEEVMADGNDVCTDDSHLLEEPDNEDEAR